MWNKGGSATRALLSSLSCLLEEAGGEAGSHTLEEFVISLHNNAFERIASVSKDMILLVLAKMNSIFDPCCLSTNAIT